MYQFYDGFAQNAFLTVKKNEFTKKQFDKLKFHKGKLVHYSTYQEHLLRYPNWNTPFVEQNNAIQIKLKGINEPICLQRNVLIYFLQDALYCNQPLKNRGQSILRAYISKLNEEREAALEKITQPNEEFSKTDYKRILPRRLLNQYSPAVENKSPKSNSLNRLLEEANEQEKRYLHKTKQANENGTLEFFVEKNKGKNYQLRFVRRAWQIMYFRAIYNEQKAGQAHFEQNQNSEKSPHEIGHHKHFNITREEHHQFSKWMYALQDVPDYKPLLRHLFDQKQFFENEEFKTLFENGDSLEQYYKSTKKKFKEWLETSNPAKKGENKYQLNNYKKLLTNSLIVINTSHFKEFLREFKIGEKEIVKYIDGKYQFPCLENEQYLISEYYYKPKFDLPKTNKQVYRASICTTPLKKNQLLN